MTIKSIAVRIKPFAAVAVFAGALLYVHHELKVHSIHEIMAALKAIAPSALGLGVILVIANYFTVTGYDFLALRYLKKRVPARIVGITSLVSFAISNNMGYAMVTGSSVRYRFYKAYGLSGIDIVTLTLFNSLTLFLGTITLFSISLITGFSYLTPAFPISHLIGGFAWIIALFIVGYGLIILIRRKPISVRGLVVPLPSPSLTLGQIGIAVIELLLASLVLFALLDSGSGIPFHYFLIIFLSAHLLGTFSQLPGGLGVFEGTFIYLLGEAHPVSSTAAALLAFRAIYYFFPMLLAGFVLLMCEWKENQKQVKENAGDVLKVAAQFVPHIYSLLLIVAGALLLVSGSTPTDHGALKWLTESLPLSVVETSHLLASIIGLLLLFMARAVRLRLDAAYMGVVILLALGAVFTFLKGYDWQEASFLGLMLLLFLPSRSFFYRKSSLMNMPFSRSWLLLIAIVFIGVLWIGFFSYRHVEYRNDLWWKFSYQGDAHRFLRASLTLSVLLIAFSLYRLLKVSPERGHLPTVDELSELETIVAQAHEAQSHLSLLGDKYILWHETKNAFLMYGVTSRFWIAMGDPVGTSTEQEDLVWDFIDRANKQGAKVAFYQVSQHHLPLYLDLGLILIKMGEEARIPLDTFGLEGGQRAGLRQTNNKLLKSGLKFEILEKTAVAARMGELKRVSDAWLATKQAKEKGFSLGFFSEDYLQRTRVCAITQHGVIVAFANVWELNNKEEISADMMRFSPDAPKGVMDFLFIQLMFWSRTEGYRWFNLGMAPLAGLETHAMAPLWHKIVNIIFEHGDTFYNFEGLLAYKEKFGPVWEPRYLAVPPLHAPVVLLNVATMIAGNWKGVFKK